MDGTYTSGVDMLRHIVYLVGWPMLRNIVHPVGWTLKVMVKTSVKISTTQFMCLSAAKLMVLDRMSEFAAGRGDGMRRRSAAGL